MRKLLAHFIPILLTHKNLFISSKIRSWEGWNEYVKCNINQLKKQHMLSLKYFGFCQNDSNQCPYLLINYNKELRTLLVAFVLGRMWTLNSEHPHFKIAWCSHTMGVRFTPHLGWKQDDLQNLPRCGFKSPTIWQNILSCRSTFVKASEIKFHQIYKIQTIVN